MSTSEDLYFSKHVFCCINIRPSGSKRGCCAEKGAEKLQAYMKKKCKELGFDNIRINNSGCLDRCELGPTMVIYPDGIWYHYQNEQDVDEIIDQHLSKGNIVKRLMLKKEQVSL